MKAFIVLCSVISIVYCKTLGPHSRVHKRNDDDYLNGGFNPGKRCVNMWDEGCVNGQLNGAGNDDNYLNGGFNPGKRSLNSLLQKLRNYEHHQQ
uniref:Uncharacterized protein n=1 Tax=Heliothis virescens TaxID=7102 RepID=A0A2A4K275_HELVI